jgi:diguanylate cyclase (GGDEF)-like protein
MLLVAAGLGYLALSQVVMWLDGPSGNRAGPWPAAGLSLAVLMLVPTRRWGWALGAIALAEIAGDLAWNLPLGATLGWTLSSTLEPLVAAMLLRSFGNPAGSLVPLRPLLRFIWFAVLGGPFAGATVAATTSALSGDGTFPVAWSQFFLGDVLGVLTVAPMVLGTASARRRSPQELVALVATTGLTSTAVFSTVGGPWMVTMPYLLIPFFAWAAVRFGTRGTAWTALGVTAVASGFNAAGRGPFVLAAGHDIAAVTLLQVFLVITVTFALLLAALVSELGDRRQLEDVLRHQATHDPLTGLANRLRLAEALELSCTSRTATSASTGLLVCDLDRLKAVNDRVGHKGGDELLVEVAARLRDSVRPGDLVARIGGDEFVIMLRDVDAVTARRVARRVVDSVSHPVLLEHRRAVRPSISVGAAVAEPGESADRLFQVADAALYEAKRRGRGQVVLADDALRTRARVQIRTEDDLATAFEDGQLVCYYQPVIDLTTGRLSGVETTVRWRHPELGLLDAERFLTAVESVGWADRLFATVLTQSLQAQREWLEATGRRLCVSVNVSSVQLAAGGVLNAVIQALAESGAPADALCLEVTKNTSLDDLSVASLNQLHALGVGLVLDGFGAGWSSMTRLARIPWDCLKIDRSFVSDLGTDPGAADIVNAMAAMAGALDIRVGAEGVARISQLEALVGLGCAVAQGSLFGRPETAEEIGRLLAEDREWLRGDLRRRPVGGGLPATSDL